MTATAVRTPPRDAPQGAALARHAAVRRAMFYPKSDLAVDDALLRALARPADPADGRALARRALAATLELAEEAVEVVPLAQQGTFHHVFAGGAHGAAAWVVRLNRLPQVADLQLHVDAIASAALTAAGLAHARVRCVDCSRTLVATDFEVLERVPGESLSAFDADDARIAPHLTALAQALRAAHAIRGSGYGFIDIAGRAARGDTALTGLHARWSGYLATRLPEHLRVLASHGVMSATQADAAAARFAAARSALDAAPACLLHGDPGNHNALAGPDGTVTLVDWEDALLGDPLYDLAFWATFHPERRWDAFFAAYFGAPWQPTAAFWLYFLRVAIAKTVHRLRFGYVDRPGRPPAAARIQRGLAALAAARA